MPAAFTPRMPPASSWQGALDYNMKAAAKSYDSLPNRYKRKSYANRARNVTKAVKLCMRRLAEHKHLTTALTATPVLAAASITSAVIMSQGSSALTRVGNQIHISEIDVEVQYTATATGTAGDWVRTIVGWDTESNGAQVLIGNVLEATGLTQPYNRDQVKPGGRIQILLDRLTDCNVMTSSVGLCQKMLRYRRKLDKVVMYQSNAGTISDVLKNNLFVIQLTGSGLVNATGNVQICFEDL